MLKQKGRKKRRPLRKKQKGRKKRRRRPLRKKQKDWKKRRLVRKKKGFASEVKGTLNR